MARIDVRQAGEFGEAAVLLAVASLAIRLLPFRLLVRCMGRQGETQADQKGEPARVRQAIRRASRRLPFRTVCFQEGLAAHWMLRRRGMISHLHYGVRQHSGRLTAHVWVEVDGAVLIGEEESGAGHLRVAVYPAPREPLSFAGPPV